MKIRGEEIKYIEVDMKDIGDVIRLTDELGYIKLISASIDEDAMKELTKIFEKFCSIAIESPVGINMMNLSLNEIMDIQTGFFMPRSMLTTKS